MSVDFRLIKSCSTTGARVAQLLTPHGEVATPLFLPVASQGTVKTLAPQELRSLGVSMILSNAYHLYLRPGIEVISQMGGLHQFMGWDGPILTDSGGYQVFSLAPLRRVSDEGVVFRSHIDGSEHFFTPELAIELQEALGGDIIMALDECPPLGASLEQVQEATGRTQRWAERCRKSHKRPNQALYGIVQGGTYPQLRRQAAEGLVALDFPGYALGGLSLGEKKQEMQAIVAETVSFLPRHKPRYLMGVGSPEDIVASVASGIDLFDSALPTRVARNGAFFTPRGRHNIRKAAFAHQDEPLEVGCNCYTCKTFSAAYVHHLFKCEELLAYRLTTLHNLHFMVRLMQNVKQAILEDRFPAFRRSFMAEYQPVPEERRQSPRNKFQNRL